jgi:drug/metabolite transporter (DMT)-like permease
MAGIRFAIGALCILLWAKISKTPITITDRKEFAFHLFNGVFFMVQISLLYLGMLYSSASHGSILMNTNIFFIALFAHFFISGDTLNIRKISGLILAFLGIIFIFYDKQNIGSFSIAGDMLVFTSAFLLAVRIIYIKKMLESLNPTKLVFWEFVVGVSLFFLASLLFEDNSSLNFTLPVTLAVLYQGIIVAGFCFVASTILLQRHNASTISTFSLAIPISGVILSHFFLGDLITKNLILGSLLVVYGIYTVTVQRMENKEEKT